MTHATRGTLVQEINQVMQVPGAVWLGVIFVDPPRLRGGAPRVRLQVPDEDEE